MLTELTQKLDPILTDALAEAIAKIAVEAIAVGTDRRSPGSPRRNPQNLRTKT